MLQTLNNTPFAADIAVFQDKDGQDTAVAVVKATFDINPDAVTVAENQAPIVKADQYYGDPALSSLKYASEVTLPKPFTDIVMNGHAYGRGRTRCLVSLKVGRYRKTVLVIGDRIYKSLLSLSDKSSPKPFQKLPLIYENAYGGSDVGKSNPDKRQNFPGNPVGKGFFMVGGTKKQSGSQVCNLESPHKSLTGFWKNPRVEGFGYIAPHWKPRSDYQGTFDRKWEQERAPYRPADFNPRFFNAAHPDLITREYLRGGEPVHIENASPEGVLSFNLPLLKPSVIFNLGGQKTTLSPNLDTLILEPDESRFMMIYRAALPCHKKSMELLYARIDLINALQSIDLKESQEP